MDAVAIDDATKTYGKQIAVNRLGLRVPRGSVYGFIGPNGSGKSTTLRMIMRIILPDSGRIEVLGETGSRAANDRIGYLPEERNIYRKMKVRDVLCFFAELKGMRRPLPHVNEWLERLDLAEHGDKKVEALSKGMG
ncbi:MAG TPA: ATP-binding cassette domain-containing protein, partial [Planctomycetia bacterium]|nr:ATP-binding cassette domain-containing protein [Planctomycetia bacterium]